MDIKELKNIIKRREIDNIIQSIPEYKDSREAIAILEEFYEREMKIVQDIQDVLASSKIRRLKNRIPNLGFYTYKVDI